MSAGHSAPRHRGAEYLRDYERGWRAWPAAWRAGREEVRGFTEGTESEAFHDGYLDYNAGRKKWHLAYCDNHGNDDGECGEG